MFRTKALSEALADGVLFETDPTTLTPEQIDAGLWELVQAINHTRWAWTRFCCEGHWNAETNNYRCIPYLQIATQKRYLSRVTEAARVATEVSLQFPDTLWVNLSVEPCSPHWMLCGLHVSDADEPNPDSLPAALRVVQAFGAHLLTYPKR